VGSYTLFNATVSLPLHLRYQPPAPVCNSSDHASTPSDCARVAEVKLATPSVLARCSCADPEISSGHELCGGTFHRVMMDGAQGGTLATILVPRGDLAHAPLVWFVTQALALFGTAALLWAMAESESSAPLQSSDSEGAVTASGSGSGKSSAGQARRRRRSKTPSAVPR
jgi:hypothetical protein